MLKTDCTNAPVTPNRPSLAAAVGAQLRRSVVYMVLLCTAIALFLTVLVGGGLLSHLIYSFAIGLCCWLLTNGLRLLGNELIHRWRAKRHLPPIANGHPIGWKGTLPLLLLGMLLGPSMGLTIGDWLTGQRTTSLLQWNSSTVRVTLALTVLASIVSLFVLTLLEHLAVAKANVELAQRQAAENQLKLLESQLEPHMLFNTLANLRVLIGTDPQRAQAMLDKLISFLRGTLGASRTSAHPLGTEFERVADYLALMAMRMGARLQVELVLPAELRGAAMPPLLLQPLVENSIRHGLEPKVAGGRIEVRARRDGPQLMLTVRDTGVGLHNAHNAHNAHNTQGTNFGLDHVRSRLATLHGTAASLSLQDAGDAEGGTVACITLPYVES